MVMKRTFYRVGFTAQQSAELWERWKKGGSMLSPAMRLGAPSEGNWCRVQL